MNPPFEESCPRTSAPVDVAPLDPPAECRAAGGASPTSWSAAPASIPSLDGARTLSGQPRAARPQTPPPPRARRPVVVPNFHRPSAMELPRARLSVPNLGTTSRATHDASSTLLPPTVPSPARDELPTKPLTTVPSFPLSSGDFCMC
ncbi:formin-like protein 5 [Iris pallida]|uniref:Formin-like protein 5 n=1 Tax=Iris pallida TaxID=29817 RepID=A0AAX6I009_IRIPA|nr:formin-like protein 5 [Iris pallida]